MKSKIILKVKKLFAEFESNGKLIPESWKPWIHLIHLFLHIAKLFTPDDVDVIIDEILAAIDLVEEAKIPLKTRIYNRVVALGNDFKANDNVIPESWLPWIRLVELFLRIAKIFTPADVDAEIDEILAEIDLLDPESKPAEEVNAGATETPSEEVKPTASEDTQPAA